MPCRRLFYYRSRSPPERGGMTGGGCPSAPPRPLDHLLRRWLPGRLPGAGLSEAQSASQGMLRAGTRFSSQVVEVRVSPTLIPGGRTITSEIPPTKRPRAIHAIAVKTNGKICRNCQVPRQEDARFGGTLLTDGHDVAVVSASGTNCREVADSTFPDLVRDVDRGLSTHQSGDDNCKSSD